MAGRQIGYLLALAAGLTLSQGAQAIPTEVEGQGGGGIVPWALLGGSKATAAFSYVGTGDFSHVTLAANTSLFNRVELSVAKLTLSVNGTDMQEVLSTALGQSNDVDMWVLGGKVKLFDMGDEWWRPTVSLGVQYKKTDLDQNTLDFIGSDDDQGIDFYVAGTKVYKLPVVEKNFLVNATVRGTKANDLGYAGFGATTDAFGQKGSDDYHYEFEGSAGVFVADNAVFGAEYRYKPDSLKAVKEDNWWDIFFAYLPSEHYALVAAYANLGDIWNEVASLNTAPNKTTEGKNQQGLYLQVQISY